jgi:hypothetical protein
MSTRGERTARLRELHAAFMTAHKAGMRALETGDMRGFSAAVETERAIIEERKRIVADALLDFIPERDGL